MKKEPNLDVIVLSTKRTIDALILKELKANIYHLGTPYIKFLFYPSVIEYLGACLDPYPFNEERHSESRFNLALTKLFPNKYKEFAKNDSQYYMYEGFRCNMVHRLIPKGFSFTTRNEAIEDGNTHLKKDVFNNGTTVLILEDFYDDIEKAAKSLIKMYDNGKAPKKKGDEGQLRVTSIDRNLNK